MQKTEPLVTVITLVYNTGSLVIEALESVKSQNYTNIQHIIVDDFSSDNSIEIVEKWLEKNQYKIEFIKHSKNEGICKSLNDALRRAEGEYVTFVSDDLLMPEKIYRQVELFKNLPKDYGVVYSDAHLINEKGNITGSLLQKFRKMEEGPSGIIFEELFFGNFIHGSAALIKLSVFKKVGFFNEQLIVEDIEMYLRIAQEFMFKFNTYISAKYRIHPSSLLHKIGLKGLEANIISLYPYYKYNFKTKKHFIAYFDNCMIRFYNEDYQNWKKWYFHRWKIKKDLKSITMSFLAVLSINHTLLKKIKYILKYVKKGIQLN